MMSVTNTLSSIAATLPVWESQVRETRQEVLHRGLKAGHRQASPCVRCPEFQGYGDVLIWRG